MCDPKEGRAAEAGRAWGADRSYTDLDDMLADPEIDAVEILTPTFLHHDHVLAAIAAGKHVSCQKPLANTVAEARAMAAAADEAGVILRVSECFRHYPPLELAKKLVGGRGHRNARPSCAAGPWWARPTRRSSPASKSRATCGG